ncbi:MAG: hypothetical protein QM751_07905 [Paludibacteraceae bacterium]
MAGFIVLLFSTAFSYGQQTFVNGNLAVLVAAASANNTTVSVVEINKTSASQTAIQTISIAGTGTNAIRVSGSATSTLYAANSNDGSLFCFTGHNSETTSSNANALLTRAVIAVDHSGNYSIKTTYTGTTGQQTRCATTLNNSDFFIGDQSGFYTNSATAVSPSGNIRSVKAFGGTVYAFTSSTSLPPVGIISSNTGGTYTALTGLENGATSRQDFYLISSGENSNTYDILYILDATSATAGTIYKYSLVNSSWTANGSYTTDFGGFGLCVEQSGTGANLYVTTGTGATTANKVKKLFDSAGFNTAINITTANNIDLYIAATGTILKGIAFAPYYDIANKVESPILSSMKITGNNIIFEQIPTSDINIYSITGSKVATYSPTQSIALKLQKGVYIIRVDNQTAKFILK